MPNLISATDCRKLVVYAINQPVLILVDSDERSIVLTEDIRNFAKRNFAQLLSGQYFRDTVYINGYNKIMTVPLWKWNNRKMFEPFKGRVFISPELDTDVAVNNIVGETESLYKALSVPIEQIR